MKIFKFFAKEYVYIPLVFILFFRFHISNIFPPLTMRVALPLGIVSLIQTLKITILILIVKVLIYALNKLKESK